MDQQRTSTRKGRPRATVMDMALHMIGNAHLDPVWLWLWPEGLQAIRATFRSALDRMQETEDFVFTSSQAAVYEWLERCEPKMFEEIRQRVAEGRWVLVGGWWVQPDCNIPGGEGFVRQSLYGQRYFQEKFGVIARVGYNVDSFGHNWMLPQILKKSGMDYYVFMRPSPEEKPGLPGRLFRWESPDGSSVLTYQIPYSYNSSFGQDLKEKIERTAGELSVELPFLMCFYGVGNHGGGPTKENLQIIQEAAVRAAANSNKVQVTFSDPEQYFAAVESAKLDIPVVKEDLQHHASGCYAAHSEIKRNNRKAEHALASAEKLAVTARELVGFSYPQAELTRAWKGVLFNHFHDILAGTCIREAYMSARNLHGQALQTADEVGNLALQAIAAQIELQGEGTPIVIWNPHSYRRVGPIQLEVQWQAKHMTLEDASGHEIPYQETATSSLTATGWRRGISFIADVPPVGYTVYWLYPRPSQARPEHGVRVTENSLSNEYLKVEFDPDTGYIREMVMAVDGWKVFCGPAAVPVVLDDPSDTWSHNIFRYDDEVGRFANARIEVVERGPVRGTLRVISSFSQSSIIQEFTLYTGLSYMDVKTTVDWHEQHKVLKLEFPVNVSQPLPTYEIQFGAISRPANGEEEPGLQWFDVSDGNATATSGHGLSILNDGKYSYDVRGSAMRLTVLRSPVYAHHIPRETEPGAYYHYIDQGRQEFTYRLVPHRGGWQQSQSPRLGHELNVPFTAVVESNHPGTLPRSLSMLEIGAPNVLVSAVKRAEDDGGYIVRVYEACGRPTQCCFIWHGGAITWEASISPFEIKTFYIPDGDSSQVREVDLLERPLT